MKKRIIIGRWDCPSCNTKGILGNEQSCPSCGSKRTVNFKPYLPTDIESNYVSEEKAKNINKNPDWLCDYCQTYNSDNDSNCSVCGTPRRENNPTYYDVQWEQMEKSEISEESLEKEYLEKYLEEEHKKEKHLPHNLLIISLISILTLLFIVGVVYLFLPKKVTIHVKELSWSRTIDIERYQTVQESDWYLPSGANLLYTFEEIHHYASVIDHYETKSEVVATEVLVGYEEYSEIVDLGNGYFEETIYSYPVYETYYETVYYEEPVYVNVPVYQTRYYYEIDKWFYERSIETYGCNEPPYWGELNLNSDERESSRKETYQLTGTVNREYQTYTISYEDWSKIRVGSRVTLKIRFGHAELIQR